MNRTRRSSSAPPPPPPPAAGVRSWVLWLVGLAAVLVVVLALRLRPGPASSAVVAPEPSAGPRSVAAGEASAPVERPRLTEGVRWSRAGASGARPPAAVVADKAARFSQGRKEVAVALARKAGGTLTPEVERFFTLAESGEWGELKGLYSAISAQRYATNAPPELVAAWPALMETFGAIGVARFWPPEELLAYGESVLAALPSGSVYVTGPDAGRFIPSLLGDGTDTARPIVMTPDMLADGSFLEYLNELHGGRVALPTAEDIAKAQQARASETSSSGGKTAALLQALVDKNPGINFAVEGTLAPELLPGDIVPLGPVMELRAGASAGQGVTPTQAGESVQYWQATAKRMQAASNLDPGSSARVAYAQLAASQADLFARNSLFAEAEQAYRAAYDIAPGAVEPLTHLAKFLGRQGRAAEALRTVDTFAQNHPDLASALTDLRRNLANAPAAGRAP